MTTPRRVLAVDGYPDVVATEPPRNEAVIVKEAITRNLSGESECFADFPMDQRDKHKLRIEDERGNNREKFTYKLDLIQILIDKNKLLRAVRCICSFDLVDKFQPVPLLKAHLANVKKTAKMRGRHRSDKIIAKIAAADSELTALRGVVRCILDYELHNEFSPTNLTRRIEILEKEKKLRKNIVPDKMDMKMCAADEGKKQSFMPLNLDRTSSGSAESSNPLPNSRGYRKRLASRATQQQQSLEKRPKTAVMSNKEVAPCVHSTEPPSQVPQYTKFKPQQIIVSPANVAGPSMGITGCAAHNVGVGQFGTIPTATSLTDTRTAPSSSTVPSYPRTAPSASY